MAILLVLVLGFLFGAILQRARLNRFNTISGMAMLNDLTVAKAILIAVGVGAILLNIEISLGLASYHVKPFILGGVVIGGLIFGVGMAILGYCPGTLAVSLGEGSVDALVGVVGGLLGGLAYTLTIPAVSLVTGPNLGKISLFSLTGGSGFWFFLLVFIFGVVLVVFAFWIHQKDAIKNYQWLYAGIALAVLNAVVFATVVSNRPIGASTTYPYLADFLGGLTGNDYFQKIRTPGNWEFIFLVGAVFAGFVFSNVDKEFKITLLHSNWKKYRGSSASSRILYSLLGGFILIYGARMAGGCTSGHIISGGMQIAVSSLVFGVAVFASLVVTGKIFYQK